MPMVAFKPGTVVKVIKGPFAGKTGRVVTATEATALCVHTLSSELQSLPKDRPWPLIREGEQTIWVALNLFDGVIVPVFFAPSDIVPRAG
jgi:hypothetical protein